MFPFTQESFDLHIDKRNILLWNSVTWLITLQTFSVIVSFSPLHPKWTRIAVLSYFAKCSSANPVVEVPNVSPPILRNVKLCIRRIASGFCFSEVHSNVSVKHSMFSLRIYEIKDSPLVCWSNFWKLSYFPPQFWRPRWDLNPGRRNSIIWHNSKQVAT